MPKKRPDPAAHRRHRRAMADALDTHEEEEEEREEEDVQALLTPPQRDRLRTRHPHDESLPQDQQNLEFKAAIASLGATMAMILERLPNPATQSGPTPPAQPPVRIPAQKRPRGRPPNRARPPQPPPPGRQPLDTHEGTRASPPRNTQLQAEALAHPRPGTSNQENSPNVALIDSLLAAARANDAAKQLAPTTNHNSATCTIQHSPTRSKHRKRRRQSSVDRHTLKDRLCESELSSSSSDSEAEDKQRKKMKLLHEARKSFTFDLGKRSGKHSKVNTTFRQQRPYMALPRAQQRALINRNEVDHLTLPEYLLGTLRMIDNLRAEGHKISPYEKHLREVIQDVNTYPWESVREWSNEIFDQLENGDIDWKSPTIQRDRARLSWSLEFNNKGPAVPCHAYNSLDETTKCSYKPGHLAEGSPQLHTCAICFYARGLSMTKHPARDCYHKNGHPENKKPHNQKRHDNNNNKNNNQHNDKQPWYRRSPQRSNKKGGGGGGRPKN